MNKKKLATSVAAVATAAALLLGGTFAWQSVNQTALNEGADTINPGGRLHDDFDGTNKDVYVENFTDPENGGQDIFARVRLEEYLEVVLNYGTPGQTEKQLLGSKYYAPVLDEDGEQVVDEDGNLVYETAYTYEYVPFTEYSNSGEADAGVEVGADGSETSYWKWKLGGSTVYMPTFNKDKDSLIPDVNGTSADSFATHVNYIEGQTEQGYDVYDNDEDEYNDLDNQAHLNDLIENGSSSAFYETYKDHISLSDTKNTHTATEMDAADKSMSMADWLAMVAEDGAYDRNAHGNCWVYDTDGWFYWSEPISPGDATGLLLDNITQLQTLPHSEWYYGLNVVAQFVTADDIGKDDSSGFYNEQKGKKPSAAAEQLLGYITSAPASSTVLMLPRPAEQAEAGNEYELWEALEAGGDIVLTDDISLSETIVVDADAFLDLDRNTISAEPGFMGDSLLTVREWTWLDIENGTMEAPADGYAISVEDEEALVYIYDGNFEGGAGAIYVDEGELIIVDGEFWLRDDSFGDVIDWNRSNYEDGLVEILIYGGTFYNFDPSNANGRNLLEDGFTVEVEEYDGDIIYTVVPEEELLPEELLPEELPEELLPEDPEGELPGEENPEGEPVEGDPAEGGSDNENTPAGTPEDTTTEGENTGGEENVPVTGGETTGDGSDPADDPAQSPESSVGGETGSKPESEPTEAPNTGETGTPSGENTTEVPDSSVTGGDSEDAGADGDGTESESVEDETSSGEESSPVDSSAVASGKAEV